MTVSYQAQVASSSIGCFLRLLFRWRGSIYKLLWKEFLVFVGAYYTLNFIYRFALNDAYKIVFEAIAKYCNANNSLIPIAFVLGFYVSIVASRWWEQFNKIPWPDRMAMFVTANMHGHDERGRLMRRTIMRYLCLSFVITMHSISPGVKKRFPSFTHMTEAGFMLPTEQKIIEDLKTPHNKYFIPLAWATSLVTRARKEGRIKDDFAVKTLIDEINEFRGMLGSLFNYDWISIPLVYTQVVTWAVYMFFLSCLMGRQFTDHAEVNDMYVPVFTFLQFFFYMGWLKVAECMVNPFGDDDDDFDINTVLDRNLQVSYLVVDEMHAEHPELIKDQYWDDVNFTLPYTAAAESYRPATVHLGSAMDINISPKMREFVIPPSVIEEKDTEVEMDNMASHPRHSRHLSSRHLIDKQSTPKIIRPMGIFHHLKKSSSHHSSVVMESQEGTPRNHRRRMGSESSQLTNDGQTASSPTTPDEMFHIDDLDGLDDVTPSSSYRPGPGKIFLDKLTKKLKSRSQRSLNTRRATSPVNSGKQPPPMPLNTQPSREHVMPLILEAGSSSPASVGPMVAAPIPQTSQPTGEPTNTLSIASQPTVGASTGTQPTATQPESQSSNPSQPVLSVPAPPRFNPVIPGLKAPNEMSGSIDSGIQTSKDLNSHTNFDASHASVTTPMLTDFHT